MFAGFLPVLIFALGMLVPSAEASAMLGLFQRRVRQYEPANRIEPTLN